MSKPNVQVYINGVLHKQYLTQSGVVSVPYTGRPERHANPGPIMYPTTHSIPGPHLLSYMYLSK